LERVDPERAAAVRERSQSAVARLSPAFAGNALTGILAEDEESVMVFEDFANEEPCPVLDPATGRCELYVSRPITCRSFGPPVRSEDGLGVCELCYHGATDEQIAECEMSVDPDDLESGLLRELEKAGGPAGSTIIAFALAD
jgi:Fe-S-cluster containining protein